MSEVINAFLTGQQYRNQLNQQQQQAQAMQEQRGMQNTAAKVQGALMQGDQDLARNLAIGSGNADIMGNVSDYISQADDQQASFLNEGAEFLGNVAFAALDLPYEQRRAFIAGQSDGLQRYGYTPDMIAQFDPTDQNLRVRAMEVDDLRSELARRGRPTSEMRNFTASRQNPEFAAYQESQRRASSPQVNINTPEPDPFQDTLAQAEADMFAGFVNSGPQAARNLRQIDRLEQLMGDFDTGGGAAIRSLASDFGVEIGEGVSDIQAFNALISSMVPAQRPAGSGPMSDADLDLFKRSLPRLINTPEGNRLIVETMREINRYDLALSNIAQRAAARELDRSQARQAVNSLQNPIDLVRAELQGQSRAPRPGDIVDGYRYNGGPLNDPASYTQVNQ
jgi:hypothetical protein